MTDTADQPTDLDHWFATEILPFEHLLTGYLARVCKHRAEIPDLRHDIYLRVYESARHSRPTHPRSFLFTTAKNLLTDRRRRERIVSIDYTPDFDVLNVLSDELTPEHRVSARQELRQLAEAFDRLTEKCRAVLWLRRVDGLSQREVAERLGLAETAVESQVARGIRSLQKRMAERLAPEPACFGKEGSVKEETIETDDESTHG